MKQPNANREFAFRQVQTLSLTAKPNGVSLPKGVKTKLNLLHMPDGNRPQEKIAPNEDILDMVPCTLLPLGLFANRMIAKKHQ